MRTLTQLFNRSQARSAAQEIEAGRVILRRPAMEDFASWVELRQSSRSFLEPWEPLWSESEFTRAGFRERIRKVQQAQEADSGYYFFIFLREGNRLAGGINLSHVRRGVAQMGSIGYWMGQPFANRGLMTEALSGLATYAFSELGLHRLEAACIPTNVASRKLLLRCLFEQEGVARNYLKIAGKWQDHLLFSRTGS